MSSGADMSSGHFMPGAKGSRALNAEGNSAVRRHARQLINSPLGQRSKIPVQRTLARLGFELVSTTTGHRAHLVSCLARHGIASVIDIGANVGQFGQLLRGLGYSGPIFSLEPLPDAYATLEATARRDPQWTTKLCAAGRQPASQLLNVSQNLTSSSLLTVNALHLEAEPSTVAVGTHVVEVQRLDDLVRDAELPGPHFVKIDVQGTELDVIAGATNVLSRSNVIRVELSFQAVYDSASDYMEVLHALRDCGFVPVGIETALENPRTGDLLQIDVLAARIAKG